MWLALVNRFVIVPLVLALALYKGVALLGEEQKAWQEFQEVRSPALSQGAGAQSAYPDPWTKPWFNDDQLARFLTPDYGGNSFTYDYNAAFRKGGLLPVGWLFLEDIQGKDNFNYTFNSTQGLDFNKDLTLGEKIQVIGGIIRLWSEKDPNAGATEPERYQPLQQLLWEIFSYYEGHGSLPKSVIDLKPSLGNRTNLQSIWDTLQMTDYGALNVFLWDVGQYFHQGCGTLMRFDFTGKLKQCGMTLRIVKDPSLRRYAVLHFSGTDPGPNADTSDWFILYYRLYGNAPGKVIREEVFATPVGTANFIKSLPSGNTDK